MIHIISISALLISVILMQLGSGSLGPLDALAGAANDFTPGQIGLLGSAHYVGFLAGCFFFPWVIRRSGHARAFALTASASAIASLLHPLFVDVAFWCVLRMLTGISIAGAATIMESWLQSKADNSNRGRIFGFYTVADMTGVMLAQGVIALLDPAHYAAYSVVAMVACMSLLPLALTRSTPPELPRSAQIRPFFALGLSPLAALGVFVAGFTQSAFRMVGPVYAGESGITAATDIAIFLALGVAGGAAIQIPTGIIADRFNRRFVLVGFSCSAILVCLFAGLLLPVGGESVLPAFIMAVLFGAATIPIYSIAATHANDFAKMEEMVQLSASLLILFALGAIASPVLAGYLIDHFNPGAMFVMIAMVHMLLVGYSLWRMSIRPALGIARYRYSPGSSLFINAILRRRRGRSGEQGKGDFHA